MLVFMEALGLRKFTSNCEMPRDLVFKIIGVEDLPQLTADLRDAPD